MGKLRTLHNIYNELQQIIISGAQWLNCTKSSGTVLHNVATEVKKELLWKASSVGNVLCSVAELVDLM